MAYFDDDGTPWWSAAEAAQNWGVSPKRIYKWIKGQQGYSKGWRKDAYGNRVGTDPRRVGQPKRRLNEGDYVIFGNGRSQEIWVRPQPYPKPNDTKIDRPQGIHQGERRSETSYDANSSPPGEGYTTTVPDPFVPPYGSDADMIYVRPPKEEKEKKPRGRPKKEGGEKKPKKQKAAPEEGVSATEVRAGEKIVTGPSTKAQQAENQERARQRRVEEDKVRAAETAFEKEQRELVSYSELGDAEARAANFFRLYKGLYGQQTNTLARNVSNKMVVKAMSAKAAREGKTLEEVAGRTIFPYFLGEASKDPEERWVKDQPEVEAARAAFVGLVESIAAEGLDGLPRLPRLSGLRALF